MLQNASVTLTGVADVRENMENVYTKIRELESALRGLSSALCYMGVEVGQPTDSSAG